MQDAILHLSLDTISIGICWQLKRASKRAVLPFTEEPRVAAFLGACFLFVPHRDNAVFDRQVDFAFGDTKYFDADGIRTVAF